MLADSYIIPYCAARPRSFGALMALYEGNFIKLAQLAGEPSELRDRLVSRTPADRDLYLTVDARTRYTRLLRLTYVFEEPEGMVADPDLSVRVFLDARMTEVLGWANYHRHAVLSSLSGSFRGELDRRWAQNMMLSKWLDYLLDKGHAFKAIKRAATADAVAATS